MSDTIQNINLGSLKNYTDRVNELLIYHNEAINDISTRIDFITNDETINDAFMSLKEIATWIDSHGANQATDLITQINTINTSIGVLETNVNTLEQNISDISLGVISLNSSVSNLETVVGSDADTSTTIIGRINALETTVLSTSTDISSLSTRVTSITNVIGDDETVGTLKYRVKFIETDNTNNKSKLNIIDTSIADLSTKIQTNTDAIGDDDTATTVKGRIKLIEDGLNDLKDKAKQIEDISTKVEIHDSSIQEIWDAIYENEEVCAAALMELNNRINELENK